MKRVIVFGGQHIARECVEVLKSNKTVDVLAFVGCEKPEDTRYGYPSLCEYCTANTITFYNKLKIDNAFMAVIRSLKPDLVFSLYYRGIFPKELISIPRMGIVNIHPSLLPRYRGPVPDLWALLNNEATTGVTMHYIDEGIDTGDIIDQQPFAIPSFITGYQLHKELMYVGVKMFKRNLRAILSGENKRTKQNHGNASYFAQFSPALRHINWFDKTDMVLRRIRAFTKPYPGSVATIANREIIFWEASPAHVSKSNLSGPGKIIDIKNGAFIVSTVDGFIQVDHFEERGETPEKKSVIFPGGRFDIY